MSEVYKIENERPAPKVISPNQTGEASLQNNIGPSTPDIKASSNIHDDGGKTKRFRRTAQQMEELKREIARDHNSGEPFTALMHKYGLRKDFLIKIFFSLHMEGCLHDVPQKYEVISTPVELKKVMDKFGIASSDYLRIEPDITNGKIIIMGYNN